MAPFEVLLLLASIDPIKLAIVPMLLLEIGAVSVILVAVPRMVVVALSIVVAFFVVIVLGSRYGRTDQGGAQHERSQNQETAHVGILARDKDTLLAVRRRGYYRSWLRIRA